MKNLQKLFEECMEEVTLVGIEPGKIIKIEENTRFKKTWGKCYLVSKLDNTYRIEISSRLLEDTVDDISVKNTIVHEILHSCKNCMNHGPEWKKVADIINRNYPQYNIKRLTSSKEKGIEFNPDNFKYVLECKECHNQFGYHRMSKVVKNYKRFKCAKCLGSFKLIKK